MDKIILVKQNWSCGGIASVSPETEVFLWLKKEETMKLFNQKKIIGILGGMGPEAAAKFYLLLTKISQQKYKALTNDAFPEIIIDSVPVPDFISDLKSKEIAKKMLISRVEALSFLPISFFCIACNTAHLLIDDLRKTTTIPFVSLIEETVKEVKRLKIEKVGLLASPTTIKTKLYQNQLEKEGVKVIIPANVQIKKLGVIIKKIVAGKNDKKDALLARNITEDLVANKAEAIILGCTELPLIFGGQLKFKTLDTLKFLAEACLRRYYQSKRKSGI